jgi:pilus assembly protein CpaB
VISGIASIVLYRLISARVAEANKAATAPVVVASRNLGLGTLVKDGDVAVTAWAGPVPKGASSRREDVVGRGVVSAIVEGEPVVESRLAGRGAGAGLAATIPPGMRAVAVSVNEVVGVAGFVVPGMRVDVLVSGNPPGQNAVAGTETRTVLQNIEVLSAGQNLQHDAEGKPITVQVVNLLTTPEQAETLSLASREMKIQLILRNPLDNEVAKTPGTAVAKLFGAESRAPAVKPATHIRTRPAAPPPVTVQAKTADKVIAPFVIEVFHGSKKTESKFQPLPEAQ